MWKKLVNGYDDDSVQVLDTLDLPGIAEYINSDVCKNIFVMVCTVYY